MSKRYNVTLTASSIGYIVQAIMNNFLPLLFVYFVTAYKIPLYLISIVIAYNFLLQILVDYFSSNFILKIGHRASTIISGASASLGLIFLAVTPSIFNGYVGIYIGVIISVTLMAIGSGLSEVLLSPIIEALPFKNKESKMSFLHSFYALGHLIIILISTAFFIVFGIENWMYLALFITIIPITEIILFTFCPIIPPEGDDKTVKRRDLFKNKTFIILFILMIAVGGCEQAIAQWVSYFAESGLNVSKTVGDLVGTSTFAFFMFLSRFLHGLSKDRFRLYSLIVVCAIGLIACYLITAISPIAVISLVSISLCGLFLGVTWPGVYSLGGKLFSSGGTVMFSMLALGGDVGCSLGPMMVGLISSSFDMKIGILFATVFPLLLLVGMILLKKNNKSEGL